MPNQVIESNNITEAIVNYFYKYRSSAKWWSFCLYTSLFEAAVLSAWAGILPQLSPRTKDIATGTSKNSTRTRKAAASRSRDRLASLVAGVLAAIFVVDPGWAVD
jgi:hypothetical protein